MDILLYLGGDAQRTRDWKTQLVTRLPQYRIRVWEPGDTAPADYALIWKPPMELLQGRHDLKAIIYLAAGVDGLLSLLAEHPGLVAGSTKLIRMEDAGMAGQMVEYAQYQVLRYFRQMDAYDDQRTRKLWQKRGPGIKEDFPVGVLGQGILGTAVAQGLAGLGFPVRGWSRSPKAVPGVTGHTGEAGLSGFLSGLRVLINLLPLTPETEDLLDARMFGQLTAPAYVINMGRGPHIVDEDLLQAVREGTIAGAALDVFREEPLPADHPFWHEPRINITPHISAMTLNDAGVQQVVEKLNLLVSGKQVSGQIDLARGY